MTGEVRLLLLRHADVHGHRGDVPITGEGRDRAERVGHRLAARGDSVAVVGYGGTRRTRETAEGILAGLADRTGLSAVDVFALRNPDLYLGGDRVSMVSTSAAFAEQTLAMTAHDVERVDFFRDWLAHPDRIGFWLEHPAPPGDDSRSVAARIAAYAGSLPDARPWRGRTVVAITHSPILRAVGVHLGGGDPGEPEYVTGYEIVASTGNLLVAKVDPTDR